MRGHHISVPFIARHASAHIIYVTKGASLDKLKVDLIDNESKILVNTSSVVFVVSPMSLGSNVFPPRVCNYNL